MPDGIQALPLPPYRIAEPQTWYRMMMWMEGMSCIFNLTEGSLDTQHGLESLEGFKNNGPWDVISHPDIACKISPPENNWWAGGSPYFHAVSLFVDVVVNNRSCYLYTVAVTVKLCCLYIDKTICGRVGLVTMPWLAATASDIFKQIVGYHESLIIFWAAESLYSKTKFNYYWMVSAYLT